MTRGIASGQILHRNRGVAGHEDDDVLEFILLGPQLRLRLQRPREREACARDSQRERGDACQYRRRQARPRPPHRAGLLKDRRRPRRDGKAEQHRVKVRGELGHARVAQVTLFVQRLVHHRHERGGKLRLARAKPLRLVAQRGVD